jgi:hypothetical protein
VIDRACEPDLGPSLQLIDRDGEHPRAV